MLQESLLCHKCICNPIFVFCFTLCVYFKFSAILSGLNLKWKFKRHIFITLVAQKFFLEMSVIMLRFEWCLCENMYIYLLAFKLINCHGRFILAFQHVSCVFVLICLFWGFFGRGGVAFKKATDMKSIFANFFSKLLCPCLLALEETRTKAIPLFYVFFILNPFSFIWVVVR